MRSPGHVPDAMPTSVTLAVGNSFAREHLRVCKVLFDDHRLAREVARADLRGNPAFWMGLDDGSRTAIVLFMDMVKLCRTDSAMTGVGERKRWQKALQGLKPRELSGWTLSSKSHFKTILGANKDAFKDVSNFSPRACISYCMQRRIQLEDINVEVVNRKGKKSQDLPRSLSEGKGYKDIARLLCLNGQIHMDTVDAQGMTPLMIFSGVGFSECVRECVVAGALVNGKDKAGQNAMMHAASKGHVASIRVLAEAGGEIEENLLQQTILKFHKRSAYRPCSAALSP